MTRRPEEEFFVTLMATERVSLENLPERVLRQSFGNTLVESQAISSPVGTGEAVVQKGWLFPGLVPSDVEELAKTALEALSDALPVGQSAVLAIWPSQWPHPDFALASVPAMAWGVARTSHWEVVAMPRFFDRLSQCGVESNALVLDQAWSSWKEAMAAGAFPAWRAQGLGEELEEVLSPSMSSPKPPRF